MRLFRCDHCANTLYFENATCLSCGSELAFLPALMDLCALEAAGPEAPGLWRRKGPRHLHDGTRWRLCCHRQTAPACNFALPEGDPNTLCVSCRLTRVLPDLSVPGNPQRWHRLEAAKRRLYYTLARLGLVALQPPGGQADGPWFEFKQDQPGAPVMTGHDKGVITLNAAEADDDERVRRRAALHEPYRTLLGHLRHECGHYYWDRLVAPGEHLADFRRLFGDERADYAQALERHYADGPSPAWQERFVSAYASAHPWEDWAETWAHYLHMLDLLETAAAFGARVVVPGAGGERATQAPDPFGHRPSRFDDLVEPWVALTLLANGLNRSLGQEDAYPFAPSAAALAKLRFVHDLMQARPAT